MSIDLEGASSSTARDEELPNLNGHHHGGLNGGYAAHGADVGADSAAEMMWMSGDDEDFGAPAPLQPRVEDFDGTEAISVDST